MVRKKRDNNESNSIKSSRGRIKTIKVKNNFTFSIGSPFFVILLFVMSLLIVFITVGVNDMQKDVFVYENNKIELAPKIVSYSCNDNDSGIMTSKKGTAIEKKNGIIVLTKIDSCLQVGSSDPTKDGGLIQEYYCSQNRIQNKQIRCNKGVQCKNGCCGC